MQCVLKIIWFTAKISIFVCRWTDFFKLQFIACKEVLMMMIMCCVCPILQILTPEYDQHDVWESDQYQVEESSVWSPDYDIVHCDDVNIYPLSSNTRYCYKLQQQHHRCNSWTHTFTHFPVITSRNVKISQKYTSHSTLLCCAYNRALFVGEKLKSRLDFYLQLYLLVSPPITVYPGNNLDSFHQFFLCFVDLPSLGACSHDCYFELCHSWVVNMNLVLRLQYCY